MRQDQYERLNETTEKLADMLLEEVDTDQWPGAAIPIDQQNSKIRGDRYWCKKNAVATVALIIRINSLVERGQRGAGKASAGGAVADEPDSLDAEVKAAEKEAEKLLNKVGESARKAEFDKRVHGKA